MKAWLILAAAAATVAATPPTRAPHLTPDGWGPVKIGMTRAQVAKALGAQLEGEPIEDADVCVEMQAANEPNVWYMFEDGKLTRISLGEQSRVTTPRGVGLGATARAVRKAYPKGLHAEPHHYLDLPGEYLTFWTVPKKRGVRFQTNLKRRVETIHAGGESIQYVEGCA
jgi:hypothetical protein